MDQLDGKYIRMYECRQFSTVFETFQFKHWRVKRLSKIIGSIYPCIVFIN